MRAPAVRGLRALARRVSGESGLTLPELLISMAILGTVLTGVVTVFASGTRSQVGLDRRFQAQVELNNALGKLRREVHNACRIAGTPTPSASLITLNMPAANPPPQPPATPCSTPSTVTWCTIGSGQRWALYRVPGTVSTCTAAGAKKYADYLTSASVFTGSPVYTVMNPITATLGRLQVTFTVDTNTSDSARAYTITDEIVLRNSAAG